MPETCDIRPSRSDAALHFSSWTLPRSKQRDFLPRRSHRNGVLSISRFLICRISSAISASTPRAASIAAGPMLRRLAPVAKRVSAEGASGRIMRLMGPSISSATRRTMTGSRSRGTKTRSAPAFKYARPRSIVATVRSSISAPTSAKNVSVRALMTSASPRRSAAARAAAILAACSSMPYSGSSRTPCVLSSRFTPTAPAAKAPSTVSATSVGRGPYPASMSAVTGTRTAFAITAISRTIAALSIC